jgi:hypothetical protein
MSTPRWTRDNAVCELLYQLDMHRDGREKNSGMVAMAAIKELNNLHGFNDNPDKPMIQHQPVRVIERDWVGIGVKGVVGNSNGD